MRSVEPFCFCIRFWQVLGQFIVCFRRFLLGNVFACASSKADIVSIPKIDHMAVHYMHSNKKTTLQVLGTKYHLCHWVNASDSPICTMKSQRNKEGWNWPRFVWQTSCSSRWKRRWPGGQSAVAEISDKSPSNVGWTPLQIVSSKYTFHNAEAIGAITGSSWQLISVQKQQHAARGKGEFWWRLVVEIKSKRKNGIT